jgi:hypothetical protein
MNRNRPHFIILGVPVNFGLNPNGLTFEINIAKKSNNCELFSVKSPLLLLQSLDPEAHSKAAEYVWPAPKLLCST